MKITYRAASKKHGRAICFIQVDPLEALTLIRSLSGQLAKGDANMPRIEMSDENGSYFSIGVTEPWAVRDYLKAGVLRKEVEKREAAVTAFWTKGRQERLPKSLRPPTTVKAATPKKGSKP